MVMIIIIKMIDMNVIIIVIITIFLIIIPLRSILAIKLFKRQ